MSRPPPLLIASSVLEWDTLHFNAHFTQPNVGSEMVTLPQRLTIEESVLPSILQKDVSKAVNTTMFVPSVSHPLMEHRNAPTSFDFTLMPLQADAFATALSNSCLMHCYPSLIHHIVHGFLIGLNMPSVSENFILLNHYKTVEED